MSSLNKVMLIGRLGKDPEVRHLENGSSVGKFSIATTESYKDKEGNKVEQTEWHDIVVWRGLAQVAEKYLTKGKLVFVEGKLVHRKWVDKEGNNRRTTEVVADNFRMLESRNASGGGSGYFPSPADEMIPTRQSAPTAPTANTTESAPAPAPVSANDAVVEEPADDLPF